MKRAGIILVAGIVLAVIAYTFVIQAPDRKEETVTMVRMDQSSLQHGDLVFRNGNSFLSDRIVALSPEKTKLSHTGVVILENQRWYVIHIVGDHFANHVKKDTLQSFIEDSRPGYFCVTRYNGSDQVRSRIARMALKYFRQKRPFDYDMTLESEDELFCTELVWRAILDATGQDVSPEKIPWRGKTLIGFLPFFRSPNFQPVYLEEGCPPFEKRAALSH